MSPDDRQCPSNIDRGEIPTPSTPIAKSKKIKKQSRQAPFFPAYDNDQSLKNSNGRHSLGDLFHDRKNMLT